MDIAAQKAALRAQMKQRLRALSEVDRAKASLSLVAQLETRFASAASQKIAVFCPLKSEPDISPLWFSRQLAHHRWLFPRITGQGLMEMVELTEPAQQLVSGPFGTSQPASGTGQLIAPEHIGMIFVPGLAFTASGRRLGLGGGYYDRFLATLPNATLTIGLCFSCQILGSLPAEEHDKSLAEIISA